MQRTLFLVRRGILSGTTAIGLPCRTWRFVKPHAGETRARRPRFPRAACVTRPAIDPVSAVFGTRCARIADLRRDLPLGCSRVHMSDEGFVSEGRRPGRLPSPAQRAGIPVRDGNAKTRR